jgi:hypothetical protein
VPFGGTVGLLAGHSFAVYPGLGPFIAASPTVPALSSAAAGATAGGLVGALAGLGVPEYESRAYQEHIKKGAYLITVQVEDDGRGDEVVCVRRLPGRELRREERDHALFLVGRLRLPV